ncbi:hypothetical protein SAMN02745165_01730 [Malonomonas rubra DSM 5091]|uniref:Uncharacterized protein n=1 Tax=Malonomonas rubra DSM 5091 TaxID=1122189 RepID=A0A1M6H896_MALRU|nr:hypothetical protein SAMN02745165_01730 [Malonomonas rubra DSM 5091]
MATGSTQKAPHRNTREAYKLVSGRCSHHVSIRGEMDCPLAFVYFGQGTKEVNG